MDFKQLQSFVAVVECRSFTQAAQYLFVSQPTISAHIRSLEEELHVPLIIRTTKSIEVTQQGRSVYRDAVEILRIRENMLRNCDREEKHILRIAASTIPASYMLPDILPEFGRLCPEIYFSIHRCDHHAVVHGVAQGEYDLGFSSVPGEGEMICRPVCKDRMVLITPVSEEYLRLHEQKETTFEQLLEHPIILREKSASGQKQADRYLSALGIDEERLNVVARANDQETVKNLVAAGMGVSLISQRAARNFIEEKRILCFELPVQSEKIIYLVVQKSQWQKAYVQQLAHYVQKKYAQEQQQG